LTLESTALYALPSAVKINVRWIRQIRSVSGATVNLFAKKPRMFVILLAVIHPAVTAQQELIVSGAFPQISPKKIVFSVIFVLTYLKLNAATVRLILAASIANLLSARRPILNV